MGKQVIVSISREYGSAGHYIAEKLSKELNIELLDRNLLDKMGENKGKNFSDLKKYDEVKRNFFLTRTVRGMTNSHAENLANMQFAYLKQKADNGDSMIIVGRCADSILRENKSLITIFISGDMPEKTARICEVRNMTEEEALKAIARHDNNRRDYHNSYSKTKWGDSRYYDLCINSSKLGLEATCELLKKYILERMKQM